LQRGGDNRAVLIEFNIVRPDGDAHTVDARMIAPGNPSNRQNPFFFRP